MNEKINAYISLFKKNKQLLIPVVALIIVFMYNIVGDFFKTNSGSNNKVVGSVEFKKEYVDQKDIENANYKTTQNKEQLVLIAGEENSIRKDAMSNDESSYMRKEFDINAENNKINVGNIERLGFNANSGKNASGQNCINVNGKEVCLSEEVCQKPEYKTLEECKPYLKDCRKDIITGLVVCKRPDDKVCTIKDGVEVCLDKETCQKFPYSTLEECKKFLEPAEVKFEPTTRNVDSRGLKNSNGNNGNNSKEVFGLNPNSKEYQKYSMLLQFTSDDPKSVQGYIGQNKNISLTKTEDQTTNTTIASNDNQLYIKPGSSYLARLMNPINNLYSSQLKPILDIIDGDLEGYRLIGEMSYQESAAGAIISAKQIVSPTGERFDVNAVAIRFEGKEMTPLFADEIDRHLGGRIGFGILSALTEDVANMTTTNNEKDSTGSINVGDSSIAQGSGVVGDTFKKLAESYKTEVKVNPKTMIIMFY